MVVGFKINGEAITQIVETIYINEGAKRVVLHYNKEENVAELLQMSFQYNLAFYKYADDGHAGITIPIESIFRLEYE